MARHLTASDRKSLIRLASTLPVGSPERKAILAGLEKSAAGSYLAGRRLGGWFGPARYIGRVSGRSVVVYNSVEYDIDPERVQSLNLRKGEKVWVKPGPQGGPAVFAGVKRDDSAE